LIEIIFQNKEDAKRFHQLLKEQMPSSLNLNEDILLIEGAYIVKSKWMNSLAIVKEAFLRFIKEIKQVDWSRKILKNNFYYEDEHEQEQIIDIINSVTEGNRRDLLPFVEISETAFSLEKTVDQLFTEQTSFSFDSFVRFRLRSLIEQLEKIVEVSIDEYKLEQEYQMFVHTLRDFLAGRKSILPVLHLILADSVKFFDEQFYEIKRKEMLKMIDRKLLSNHPVYIDSVTIAPLLSIAPKTIFLYTDDPEQPLVRTICNLFEERVVVSTVDTFHETKTDRAYTADENL